MCFFRCSRWQPTAVHNDMYLGRWKTQPPEGINPPEPPNLEGSKVSCATQPRECCGKTRLCSVPNCAFTWKKVLKNTRDWKGSRFLKNVDVRNYTQDVYIYICTITKCGYICVYIYMKIYLDMHTVCYIGICVFVGEHINICIYMIIYTYIYTFTCICICTMYIWWKRMQEQLPGYYPKETHILPFFKHTKVTSSGWEWATTRNRSDL